jgi:large subunit ribosomal protein L29
MDIKELRDKSTEDLNRLLQEMRDRLRALRFKLASRQLANVREIRKVRQIVARTLTVLESRKAGKQESLPRGRGAALRGGKGEAGNAVVAPVDQAKS